MIRVVGHPLGPLPTVQARDAAWRRELDDALVPGGARAGAIERLHQPGALVITTGQQPGLFTGPLYSVHKALSAAAVARVLEQRWRRPVVPVFWLAGDDHDFAEASVATWADTAGSLVEWRLPGRPANAPQRPMSAELLPASVVDGLALLEGSLPAGDHRGQALDWLRRHYQPGATLHSAFRGAMAELLARFGVVCFDPVHPAAKRAQVPLLRDTLRRAPELDAALAALPDAGTVIKTGDGATLVFITTSAGRDRLLIEGQGFRTRRSGDRFSASEIEQLLEAEPDRFSANVLLRPVVESVLIPTVAYLGGPGELRYLESQCAALYPLLGVQRQVPVPRWSGTVIEHWTERLLDRLQLDLHAVLADDGTIARMVLERDFPADARVAIDTLRARIDASTAPIAAAGRQIDPVLERAIAGRMRRMDQLSVELEKVILRHLRKRNDIAHSQYRRVQAGLCPRGKPQERVLTAASFLGRYGDAWPDAVFTAVSGWAEGVPKDGT